MEQHTPYSVWDSLDSPDDFNLDIKLSPGLDSLSRIMPHFFVPTLEDKPQNPIMENLKLESMNTTMAPRAFRPVRLPQELMTLAMDIAPLGGTQSYSQSVEEMWRNAVVRKRGVKASMVSLLGMSVKVGCYRVVYCLGTDCVNHISMRPL